jgi:hypothetical protein
MALGANVDVALAFGIPSLIVTMLGVWVAITKAKAGVTHAQIVWLRPSLRMLVSLWRSAEY